MIKIVNIKDTFVYPIFKNGKSSIEHYAKKYQSRWLLNEQCRRAKFITVFLRDPKQRFVSGVHSFIEFEKRKNKNLDYDTMLHAIQHYSVTNEHFLSQYHWLENLKKYFSNSLVLKSVDELYNFIPNRDAPRIPQITEEQRNKISRIEFKDLKYDNLLFDGYIGRTIPIDQLLTEIKNALS